MAKSQPVDAGAAKIARTEERRTKGLLSPAEIRSQQKGLTIAAFFAAKMDPDKMVVEVNELPFVGITDSPKHLSKLIKAKKFPAPDVLLGNRYRAWKLSTLFDHLGHLVGS